MAVALEKKRCEPCSGNTPALEPNEIREYSRQIDSAWRVVDQHHLERDFTFDDFQQALDFVNRIGEVAESEQHHPDIFLGYGKAQVRLWTHAIDGLSENDFIMAAKVDKLV